jgi:hypothetical protein
MTQALLKFLHQDAVYVGEVKYYFFKIFGVELRAFALVSLFSPPNEHILKSTQTTLPVCRYYGERMLMVIDVVSILSVVAMIPYPFFIDGHGEQYFMVEQIGLDVIEVDSLEDHE